ncbi:methyltransferase domain-containing protein [Methanothermobacter thermautotrophicus]|uniref:methyltransferase domain-containing protein n=1 Tax=Methanothermobacter thermautotrophicus TaxID=145262 RepID=UPI0022B959BD|nr:methyltransferase domain-containing protein [Methanothermobacter thermautotrophicus]WBF08769.1 methyltransferase domain-containing protein [Methanothermobacter thermautotrophicus]
MRFRVTPYHGNLLGDHERLAAFREAISSRARGLTYDLGAGSGILSFFASEYADRVIAIERDPKIAACAGENLSGLDNVSVVNEDALHYEFTAADTIICEMLDTALIDEEQVPVLRRALKFLRDDGTVIPQAVFNAAEPVTVNFENIMYDENLSQPSSGPMRVYDRVEFRGNLPEIFRGSLKLQASSPFNAIRIISFTLTAPGIICGPTPMMNPPLIIPLGETGDKGEVEIKLSYRMGGGLDSVEASII